MTDTTRRAVVLGAGGAGLAAVLTACAGYGTASGGQTTEATAESEPSAAASKKKEKEKVAEGLAKTSAIPEGGGKVFDKEKVVVTQPAAGEFKAFSAICTHQGCTVATVSNGTINCPCHGSKYNIADGSVVKGPATKPLAAKKIDVKGGEISIA
ncbi:Rieske (2Fe-2S) protein [Nonomuraea sediminis]|uniref:Rieske (2Fe-2S) protein n=1 Tax=Nonomuraea sediminis TaxID=2835864 RepID=UPI001BDC5492|nr:Rieske (2Fe-2S) protein [Nonomuraea sediminis]